MNALITKIYRLIKSEQLADDVSDINKIVTNTAAVPGPEEPKQLHPGRRRVKESFTSHWDLDYLPRKEVDKIMAEIHGKQD
ncbi:MAG: hypothetical protein Q8N35_18240 [Methylococcaceae bacterium]|jgi:hypothetical protein|nr:hypothetical protein [Methylococcaceae bacterium]MDZ4155073.1 hypothetical protein [Methylococcales bacterium]MDP2394482.1 hypothetical protein [Methylococcaceae bacterium]MDP3021525.1 hypothetical protein [Methylococcaceae bacterium]MDP3390356.1 hypothetical protein [Methylococcaceae bacterium]